MTTLFASPTLIGLLLQSAGVLMNAVLCLTLLRTIRRAPLVPWTAAWITLFIALMTLLLAMQVPSFVGVLYPLYMFLEYVFGYLVFAGCREYATGRPASFSDWSIVVALLAPALVIPPVVQWDLALLFAVHSFLYGCLFLFAFRQLLHARPNARSAPGVRVLIVAILLLAGAYIAYAPIFALYRFGMISPQPPLLEYASFCDSLFLTMLGFGMVMVSTGEVQSDLEVARDRLARIAQTDHLTSAFNRYAFHTLIEGDFDGVAVIADIDNLKSINDQYGHSAGDTAIRAVATAIRSCIRADDLLFRWGGDEFLVLLLGFTEIEARTRLGLVNEQLRSVVLADGKEVVAVSVSMGFAAFDSAKSLDEVIHVADSAMYGTKRNMANGPTPEEDAHGD